MSEDLKETIALQVLEDVRHEIRPDLLKERKAMERRVEIAKKKPAVVLQRHSLMNERPRVRRSTVKSSPRRHSMRKRKSDELSGVDLSQLGFAKNPDTYPSSNDPPPQQKSALDNIGDVFSDMNSRWQRAFQQGMGYHDDEDDEKEDHPRLDLVGRSNLKPLMDEVDSGEVRPPPLPTSPTFRKIEYKHSSSLEGDSPCSVEMFSRGCGACFWERSLAWSEDDDDDTEDDGIVQPSTTALFANTSLREHLSVPKHLGKEFAQIPERKGHFRRSSSREVTVESDSRHRLPSAKMFRQTDIDNVTEIHWEEKVLDTSTLEMMAKLSL
mmetsp:Transcript_3083/g.4878  ORF Transcript_3083/g.4878 Transcript_3083/m.4878 type:complete len:325 (-) Transcript_3083:88-1062(-)